MEIGTKRHKDDKGFDIVLIIKDTEADMLKHTAGYKLSKRMIPRQDDKKGTPDRVRELLRIMLCMIWGSTHVNVAQLLKDFKSDD